MATIAPEYVTIKSPTYQESGVSNTYACHNGDNVECSLVRASPCILQMHTCWQHETIQRKVGSTQIMTDSRMGWQRMWPKLHRLQEYLPTLRDFKFTLNASAAHISPVQMRSADCGAELCCAICISCLLLCCLTFFSSSCRHFLEGYTPCEHVNPN